MSELVSRTGVENCYISSRIPPIILEISFIFLIMSIGGTCANSKSVFDETACLTKYDLYEGATIEIFDQTGKLVTSWTTSKNDNPKVINNLSVGSKYTAIIKSIKNGELKKEHKGEVTIPNNGSAIIRFVVEEINDTKNKVKVNVRCYDKSGDEFSSKVEFKILDKEIVIENMKICVANLIMLIF